MNIITSFDKKFSVKEFDDGVNVTLEKLPLGMGHTLGNALRRTLLSMMPGFAVSGVIIDKAKHEFDSIDGVREDVIEIILNLKNLCVSITNKQNAVLRVNLKGKDKLCGSDFEVDSAVKIHNPELVLAHLDNNIELNIELYISSGFGYVSSEKNTYEGFGELPYNFIKIDSMFNPVKNVHYNVKDVRSDLTELINEKSYDILSLNVVTDGSVSPKESVQRAAYILKHHFSLFDDGGLDANIFSNHDSGKNHVLNKKITELDIGVRSLNCLEQEDIDTLGKLAEMTEKEVMLIENLGKVSLDEIRGSLKKFGLTLRVD